MPISISLEILASVSSLASLSVIVTVSWSRDMRKKIFNQIILVSCSAGLIYFQLYLTNPGCVVDINMRFHGLRRGILW
jgi:hypothetical protein